MDMVQFAVGPFRWQLRHIGGNTRGVIAGTAERTLIEVASPASCTLLESEEGVSVPDTRVRIATWVSWVFQNEHPSSKGRRLAKCQEVDHKQRPLFQAFLFMVWKLLQAPKDIAACAAAVAPPFGTATLTTLDMAVRQPCNP